MDEAGRGLVIERVFSGELAVPATRQNAKT